MGSQLLGHGSFQGRWRYVMPIGEPGSELRGGKNVLIEEKNMFLSRGKDLFKLHFTKRL
jgi:hypothetical protein